MNRLIMVLLISMYVVITYIKKREIKIEECKYERKQEKIENKINEIIILGREINYFFLQSKYIQTFKMAQMNMVTN